MKRLMFLLLAAVLLGSMSAFAQNDNGEPLKGDVNGDDVVDVADVVAVLQIMKEGEGIGERHYYVSIGTTPVTESNFKNVNNATQVVASSYESQYVFTPSGTDYVYVLVADDYWVTTITNQSSNTPVDFSIVTDVEISGYTVYRTNNKVSGTILVNIEHVKYYWYVGQTDPSTMTSISPIVDDNTSPGWRLIGTDKPVSGTILFDGTGSISMNSSTKVTQYIAINSTDVNLGFYDSLGNEATTFVTGPTVINGWNVYTTNSKSKSFDAVLKVK